MSFCERCFGEMSDGDARWSKYCGKCHQRSPGISEIRALYDRKNYSVWSHLKNPPHATTPTSNEPTGGARVRHHPEG